MDNGNLCCLYSCVDSDDHHPLTCTNVVVDLENEHVVAVVAHFHGGHNGVAVDHWIGSVVEVEVDGSNVEAPCYGHLEYRVTLDEVEEVREIVHYRLHCFL